MAPNWALNAITIAGWFLISVSIIFCDEGGELFVKVVTEVTF